MRALVIAIGDLARSPRAVLQARALADAGADVALIGLGEPEWPDGACPERLAVWSLDDEAAPAGARRATWSLVHAARRAGRLTTALWRLLVTHLPAPDIILVQNPPGVPALALAWLAARRRSAVLVVDWHNLTGDMLRLRVGVRAISPRLVDAYEHFFGRRADLNLFVSDRMRDALAARWGLEGLAFPDRPARIFAPLGAADRRRTKADLLARVGEPATEWPVVMAPTSWTLDEDFDLLLDALVAYERRVSMHGDVVASPFVLIITGQGPRRARFEERVSHLRLTRVSVRTAWLDIAAYARAVAAADVVLSLHRSASGLDLPMKVLDAFGAGTPVCAFDYATCIRDLVVDTETGVHFDSAETLADAFARLFRQQGGTFPVLERLRAGVAGRARLTWEDAWRDEVLPELLRRVPVTPGALHHPNDD